MNEPTYTEKELACAIAIMTLLYNELDLDCIRSLTRQFVAHKKDRSKQRQNALTEAARNFIEGGYTSVSKIHAKIALLNRLLKED